MKQIYRIYICTLLVSVSFFPVSDGHTQSDADEIIFTFITANDGHWRPADIDSTFDLLNRIMINAINERGDVDLVIFNGDQVDRYAYIEWWNKNNPADSIDDRESHFNIPWLYDVKELYNDLEMPYYVVQGNHDRATWGYWEEVWGYPAKHHYSAGPYAFILLTRHDDRLVYYDVDYDWLENVLTSYQNKQGIFIFIHAGDSGVVNATFQNFIANYPNVHGMFFGHFHTDEVDKIDGLYYFWNGNFMNPFIDYGYRVVYIHASGKIDTYFMNLGLEKKTNRVTIMPTSVTDPVQPDIPPEYLLQPNYPNPFNPSTNISYALPYASHVTITIYNVAGREIETIVDDRLQPGYYHIEWLPATDISSGVYIYRLQARGLSEETDAHITRQRKMIYLR